VEFIRAHTHTHTHTHTRAGFVPSQTLNKYWTRLKVVAGDKHFSLFRKTDSDKYKRF
jgi:hypothetical protein